MPRVLRHSGTVLANLQLVTVTFDGYGARDLVERFGEMIVGSSWFTTVGAEYGVRRGSHLPPVRLGPPPASLTRSELATLIKDRISDGTLPRPAATANQVLYLVYLPPSVARGSGLDSAIGYHEMATLDGARFPIAVVIDNAGDGGALPTLTAAHQLINAVTNPYEAPDDGFYADPPMIDPWCLARGEVADLCEGEAPILESGFALPRVYSDRAAMSGKPPCLPAVPGDRWHAVTANPSTMQMVRRGGSVMFELTGWSTEEVEDWKLGIKLADFSQLTLAELRPELSHDMINNGLTVTLTLRVPTNAQVGETGGVYVLSGENQNRWAVGLIVK